MTTHILCETLTAEAHGLGAERHVLISANGGEFVLYVPLAASGGLGQKLIDLSGQPATRLFRSHNPDLSLRMKLDYPSASSQVRAALAAADGNRAKAAEALGIGLRTLVRWTMEHPDLLEIDGGTLVRRGTYVCATGCGRRASYEETGGNGRRLCGVCWTREHAQAAGDPLQEPP